MNGERRPSGDEPSRDERDAEWRELEAAILVKGKSCPLTAELVELALDRASPELAGRLRPHIEQCEYCRSCLERQKRAPEHMRAKDEAAADPAPPGSGDPRSRRGAKRTLADMVRDLWGKPLAVAVTVLFALLFVGGAGGAVYHFARAPLLAQLHEIRRSLGLDRPVRTEGFLRKGPDTLLLMADVSTQSIQRVVFRRYPGDEGKTLYEAAQPRPGFVPIRAEHSYDQEGTWAGKTFTVAVEFIPFEDLEAEKLLAPEVWKQEVFLSPFLGLVLDPGGPVRLHVPPAIEISGEDYDGEGRSLVDGFAFVLVRPRGDPCWYLQNYGKWERVAAGHPFRVPCKFSKRADEFQIAAVVVPAKDEAELAEVSPFPAGMTQMQNIPNTDLKGRPLEPFGPVEVKVTRSDSL